MFYYILTWMFSTAGAIAILLISTGHAYSFGYSINHTLHVLSMHKKKGFPCLVIPTSFWNPLNFFIYQKVDNNLGYCYL
jgi:hypothetical protein